MVTTADGKVMDSFDELHQVGGIEKLLDPPLLVTPELQAELDQQMVDFKDGKNPMVESIFRRQSKDVADAIMETYGTKPVLTESVKYDSDKPRFDLVPSYPFTELARVYAAGSKKYADRNWELGMKFGRVYAAMFRHLLAFWSGEKYDSDSKCHHLAAVAWGCFALMEYEHKGTGEDDRPRTNLGINHGDGGCETTSQTSA